MNKIALVGNPNCGKTTLFNALTGATAHVGNWPGVTVEQKYGTYKSKKKDIMLEVVDLPGIYSFSPYTPEEVISRNYILEEKPDCVLNIVDATNLERNLFLTTQLLEINVPVVVALNMADALEKSGSKVDVDKLQRELGVPVVLISALKNTGFEELINVVVNTASSSRQGQTVVSNANVLKLVEIVREYLRDKGVDNTLYHALKLIEGDTVEAEHHPQEVKVIEKFKETLNEDDQEFEAIIIEDRYDYISNNYSNALTRANNNIMAYTKSDKIDKVLTHRWFGIPIFLVILFAVFHICFSSNFLYLKGILNESWVSLEGTAYEGLFGSGADGIAGPGMIFVNLIGNTVDIIFGWVGGLFVNSPLWLNSLVNDGILAGVGAVLGFAPWVLSLLLCMSIMENTGYMARVAFLLDKIFRKFGLSGRAFIPMIMGFACSVPAITNTKTLSTEQEKTSTVRVIPFFTCGAKVPVLTSIAGAIVAYFGIGNADVITYLMYVLGIAVAITAIILMRNTTMRGENPPFVMELPTYRMPQFRATMLLLWDKFKGYVKRAFTIILLSTVIVWFLTSFDWSWAFIGGENVGDSIIASIGQFIQPLFTPLGFGSQLGAWGWVFGVAAISGLLAKENIPAMFATFAAILPVLAGVDGGDGSIGSVSVMISATGITVPALLAYIAFNMTTIPCFAAVASAKAELTPTSYKNTIWFWILTSFVVASVVYTIGTWWWTSLIWGTVAVVVGLMIRIVNNRRDAGLSANPFAKSKNITKKVK